MSKNLERKVEALEQRHEDANMRFATCEGGAYRVDDQKGKLLTESEFQKWRKKLPRNTQLFVIDVPWCTGLERR